jgi:hypothetical protein
MDFEGLYELVGTQFIVEGRKALIKKRKKPVNKPEEYLCLLEPFQYVSSLFPVSGSKWRFDYESSLYELSIDRENSKVEVEKLTEE